MATIKKGMACRPKGLSSYWRHMRPVGKRMYWKAHRFAEKQEARRGWRKTLRMYEEHQRLAWENWTPIELLSDGDDAWGDYDNSQE